MGLLISVGFNLIISLWHENIDELHIGPEAKNNISFNEEVSTTELNHLDSRSSRAGAREIEISDPGGSWTDSFVEDTGINWGMSDHLNQTNGNIKIDSWEPKPFQVDNYTRALWHFDEGSGSTTKDASPNNNDGSVSGPTWTTGRYNNALDFNAGSNRVAVGSSSSLNFGAKESFTIETWVKTAATRKNILVKYRESASYPAYYQVYVRNDGSAAFQMRCSNAHQISLTTVTKVNDDKWHYIAGVRDSEDDKIYIYLDGKFEGEANDTTTGAITTTAGISIGKYYGGSSLNFDGIIDEIRISNKSRSPLEIKRTYGYVHEFANLTSKPIQLPENMAWDTIVINRTQPLNTYLNISILNAANNQPIPGGVKYTYEGDFDISYIDPQLYPKIKLNATFKSFDYATPILHFWGVSWNLTNNWIDTFFAGEKTEGKFNIDIIDGAARFKNSGILRSSAINIPINHYYDKLSINMNYQPSSDFYFSIIDAQSNLEIIDYRDLTDEIIDLSELNPLTYPAIKLRAQFDANGAQSGSILDWCVNWTQNHAPKILDISSGSPVNRTHSAIISVSLTDPEETEKKLSMLVKYKGPNDSSWQNEYLSTPTYFVDHWACFFTPDKDADLGLYSFKFICNDSFQYLDSCTELDLIEVINNKPTQPDVLILPTEPQTKDDLIVHVGNSTDVETDQNDLKYWFQWFKNTRFMAAYENWTMIPNDHTTKDEHWECKVFPFDGVDVGPSADFSVIIQNSEPTINPEPGQGSIEDFANIVMYEDTNKVLKQHFHNIFFDDDNDPLEFEASGQNNIVVEIFQENGTIELIPPKDWFGMEFITLTATDPYSNPINFEMRVEVIPVNDLPRITKIGNQPTFTGYPDLTFFTDENNWLNLTIEVEDIDGDKERNMIKYFINNTQQGKINLDNNQLNIHPDNSDVGWIFLNVSITDNNATPLQYVSQHIRILVNNINDPPSVKINEPKDGTEFLETEKIAFECNVSDIDLLVWGSEERFTYEWTTDVIKGKILGTSKKLTDIQLPPGNHTITVKVFDSGNAQANDSVLIFVKATETETPSSLEKSSSLNNWWLWIVIVIIIIIILAVFFVFYSRHKKKKLKEMEMPQEQLLQPAVAYIPDSGLPGFPTTATSAQLTQPRPIQTEPLVSTPQIQIAPTPEPPPQLPPAGGTSLTLQQKLLLLEERLLAGEINQEIYLNLKAKYETEVQAAQTTPQLPPASIQSQAPATEPTTPTQTPAQQPQAQPQPVILNQQNAQQQPQQQSQIINQKESEQ
jgi:hypothetical protein